MQGFSEVQVLLGGILSLTVFFVLANLIIKWLKLDKKTNRPSWLLVFCTFSLWGILGLIFKILSGNFPVFSSIQNTFGTISSLANLVLLYGLWKMKKWAVLAYMGLFLIDLLLGIFVWHQFHLVIFAVLLPIIILLVHWNKFS